MNENQIIELLQEYQNWAELKKQSILNEDEDGTRKSF